ncbi:MAG: hypothetical protein ABIF19_18250 [Planctomycetota bacterium]
MKMLSLTDNYTEDIKQHRTWLENFDERRLKKWEDLLQADPEAAICEAKTRLLMADHNVDIQPYEHLPQGGPDFWCSRDGKDFYVETTCISIEAATRMSRLYPTDSPDVDDSCFEDMTKKFHLTISRKIEQCSKVKAPRVIVIGTLHPKVSVCCIDEAAAEELQTATTEITRNLSNKTREPIGETYEVAQLENSAFIKLRKGLTNWIEHARCPISAAILCGFGSNPPNTVGCLHPSPNYTFDRALLPKIKFCRLNGVDHRRGNIICLNSL